MTLQIINLTVKNSNKTVINKLNVTFEDHSINFIMGNNGVGKTTLIKSILGINKISSGEILFNGHKINFSKNNIGILEQNENYNHQLPITVKNLIALGRINFKNSNCKNIDKIMEFFDLKKIENKLITEISGGQRQKAFISRLLVQNPDIIILDEPFNNLDEISKNKLLDYFKKNKENIVIIIDHNVNNIEKTFDSLLYLKENSEFDFGTITEISDKNNL